jgi:hypothetical protein
MVPLYVSMKRIRVKFIFHDNRMNSETGGILGIFGFIISMGGAIYAAINHKKIRCRCCGRDLDVSVDVDSTIPTSEEAPPNSDEPEPEVAVPVSMPPPVPPPRKKNRRPVIAPAPPEPPTE